MKEYDLESLFKEIVPAMDREEPAEGHKLRFLRKLNAENTSGAKGVSWWKPLAIAASVLFLFGLFLGSYNQFLSVDNSMANIIQSDTSPG